MLKLESVSKYYRTKTSVVQALRRVSLTLKSGEFVVVTGESGSGKSTLLNVISGLDTYEEGEFYINGEESSYYASNDWERYRREMIGNVFQDYNIIDAYTVLQNVESVLAVQGWGKEERKRRALSLIERVGLAGVSKQRSSTLSGGEKQRVAIARALAKGAPIIVADEPTGNLDKASGQNIIRLLEDISKDRLVIMVTHDAKAVEEHATRRIRLFDGEIVEDRVLKETDTTPVKAVDPPGTMSLVEKWRTAWRNLVSAPKRLVLQLLIAMTVVFIFSLAYGAYVQAEHTPRAGYHPFFSNLSPSRLIVLKNDASSFTEDELEDFAALDRVMTVIPFDPALELTVNIRGQYRDFGLMPHTILKDSDLETGRLPTTADEIIVPSGSGYSVDDEVSVTLRHGYWFRQPDMPQEQADFLEPTTYTFTVAGVAASRSGNLHVSPSFFDDPFVQFHSLMYDTRIFLDDVRRDSFIITTDEGLGKNDLIVMVDNGPVPGEVLRVHLEHPFSPQHPVHADLTVSHVYDEVARGLLVLVVHPETFETLFSVETKQAALIVTDAFDAARVADALDAERYHSVYPASYTDDFDMQTFVMLWLFIGLFLLFVVMYFIAYVSLRSIMRARTKEFVIYRSIGATRADLHHITIFEMLIVFALAFVLAYAVFALDTLTISWLPDALRYYTVGNYLFIIALMLSIGWLLAMRFNRKLFTESVISTLKSGAGE